MERDEGNRGRGGGIVSDPVKHAYNMELCHLSTCSEVGMVVSSNIVTYRKAY